MCTIEPICFTAQTHVNDLHDMSTNSKDNDDNSGVIIIGDNGPDYAPKSNKVFLSCSHLVSHVALIILSYAPGDSARNSIEYGWASLSRFIGGVILGLYQEKSHQRKGNQR